MLTHASDETIVYDGSQLRAHWLLARFGLVGDALVAFRGPCAVRGEEMADLADLDGPGIAGADMVHFVWETFTATDLLLAVHRQRLRRRARCSANWRPANECAAMATTCGSATASCRSRSRPRARSAA
jgi:hypothetical protein